jgi:phenylalanyl-tRNA synthetase beta chain
MKASLHWLRELLPTLTSDTVDAREAARRLTLMGLEVEGTERFGEGIDPVVVASVESLAPHPTKSGLRLVTVSVGDRSQTIVCGAPNVPDPGGLVVLAPLGTHLPAKNMTIEPRAIGGVTSEGMLCSESELGIGAGGDGILVLPARSARAGQRFLEAFPSASDHVLEISVTPNRPDALGHVGIARDLAVSFGMDFVEPATVAADTIEGAVADFVTVRVEDAEACPVYGASVITDVVVGPSPLAYQHRLTALGTRPISNVVDVTNWVLLERSQPLHAFDLDKIQGGEVIVRRAKEGETLLTLDGVKRTLFEGDLIIADGSGPIALAGVMGGASTEVSSATKRVLLECAYFDPRAVRRTAKRHGLHTEASHRFERGIDREGQHTSLARGERLLTSLAGGKVLSKRSFVEVSAHPRTVTLRSQRLDELLGLEVPFAEAEASLTRLGFVKISADPGSLTVSVPSFRPDVSREADLIEEVARVRGLDSIPTVLPRIKPQPREKGLQLETQAKSVAMGLGLSEAITYAFVSPRELSAVMAKEAAVTLLSPLTEERSVMRTSLLPGLLEALRRARRRGERTSRLFTLGRVFLPSDESSPLPREPRGLTVVLAGPRLAHLQKAEDHDVFDAKATAVEFVERLLRRNATVLPLTGDARPLHLHPRGAGAVRVGDVTVGTFGPLHPDVVEALDLDGGAQLVEIDLEAIDQVGSAVPQSKPIPRLPAVTRDVSLVVPDAVAAGEVAAILREAAGDLCAGAEVFDVFRGGSVPAGHRSLTFRLVYRDPRDGSGAADAADAKTLTDAEVDKRHSAAVEKANERLGAVLRA